MLPRFCAITIMLAGGMILSPDLLGDEPKPKKDAELIQGTWSVIELHQVRHEPTKEEKEYLKGGNFKVTITSDKIIFHADKSEGKYHLDNTKTPKILRLTVTNPKAETEVALAIYELKGDDLKICIGRGAPGEKPEPPADFDVKKAKPGTFPTLFMLKRDTAKKGEKK